MGRRVTKSKKKPKVNHKQSTEKCESTKKEGLRVCVPRIVSRHKLRNDDIAPRSARGEARKSAEAERSRMRRRCAGIDEIIRNRQTARLRAVTYRERRKLRRQMNPAAAKTTVCKTIADLKTIEDHKTKTTEDHKTKTTEDPKTIADRRERNRLAQRKRRANMSAQKSCEENEKKKQWRHNKMLKKSQERCADISECDDAQKPKMMREHTADVVDCADDDGKPVSQIFGRSSVCKIWKDSQRKKRRWRRSQKLKTLRERRADVTKCVEDGKIASKTVTPSTKEGCGKTRKEPETLTEDGASRKPVEAKYTVGQLLDRARLPWEEMVKINKGSIFIITETQFAIQSQAEEYIDTFEFEMAQKFCQRALELEPDNVQALETCGTLLLEMEDLQAAKHCFGRAIEVKPDEGHSKYMNMGQLLGGADAIECFSRGLALMVKEQSEQTEATGAGDASTKEAAPVTDRDVSCAHCSVAEIYLTDACFEADAEERCKHHLDEAIKKDSSNPEAFHLLASFFLSKDETESAKEMINKGVALWLPQMKEVKPDGATVDLVEVCAVSYPARVNASKILIELEQYDQASEILELLLDEEDEAVEVWYLLGWLNNLQGEDCFTNARYYLQKAHQVAAKSACEDEAMLKHIEELLQELGPGDDDDEDDNGKDGEDDMDMDTDEEEEETGAQNDDNTMDH